MRTPLPLFLLSLTLLALPARADPDYHIIGWVNTVVPGGGQYLLGNYLYGALQTTLEAGTFLAGFRNSKRVPMTLDGVPEDLPAPSTHLTKKVTCVRQHGNTVCTQVTTGSATSNEAVDISRSLYADWLQEFGLKYHMVNVFDSYRQAAGADGGAIDDQRIDQTPTKDLFLAPFRWNNISSLWVYPALVVTVGALIYNYQTSLHDGSFGRIAPLKPGSQTLYDLTYLGVFPVGSAAPEEMFYRGFLQHEAYGAVRSPFFSLSMSSALYAFSHSADDRLSAAITGLYLGIVSHANGGELSKGIAYHFWADVFAGIYQIAVVRKESGKRPLMSFDFKF